MILWYEGLPTLVSRPNSLCFPFLFFFFFSFFPQVQERESRGTQIPSTAVQKRHAEDAKKAAHVEGFVRPRLQNKEYYPLLYEPGYLPSLSAPLSICPAVKKCSPPGRLASMSRCFLRIGYHGRLKRLRSLPPSSGLETGTPPGKWSRWLTRERTPATGSKSPSAAISSSSERDRVSSRLGVVLQSLDSTTRGLAS